MLPIVEGCLVVVVSTTYPENFSGFVGKIGTVIKWIEPGDRLHDGRIYLDKGGWETSISDVDLGLPTTVFDDVNLLRIDGGEFVEEREEAEA